MIKRILMVTLFATACGKSAGGGGTAAPTEPAPAAPSTVAGGGGDSKPAEPNPGAGGGNIVVNYPDTTDGLQKLVSDAAGAGPEQAAAIDASLVLPNAEAWFRSVFGDDTGQTVYADYAPMAARMGSMSKVFASNRAAGKTEIRITKVEDSTTEGASRDQRKAMGAMVKKVPLYRVQMLPPGEDLGFSMASFAYVNGAFRFVGSTRVP